MSLKTVTLCVLVCLIGAFIINIIPLVKSTGSMREVFSGNVEDRIFYGYVALLLRDLAMIAFLFFLYRRAQ